MCSLHNSNNLQEIHVLLEMAQMAHLLADNVLPMLDAFQGIQPAHHAQIIGSISNSRYLERSRREAPFDIYEYSDTWCQHRLRFKREFVIIMAEALFPNRAILQFTYQQENGTIRSFRVDRVEALCIVLFRFAWPERLIDMEEVFPHEKGDLSRIFNHVRVMDASIYMCSQVLQ